MIIMNYLELLLESYKENPFDEDWSRLEFLGQHVFDFTTYDGEVDEIFATNALATAEVISKLDGPQTIFDGPRYLSYLTMCNMPFFIARIDWGTSIRTAFWDTSKPIKLKSSGLWKNGKQIMELEFTAEQWKEFISAMRLFVDDK